MEGPPGLEHLQRGPLIDGGDLGQGGLLAHDHTVHALQLGCVEHCAPGIAGGVLGQPSDGGGIIDLVRIALLDAAPAGLGDAGLEGDDGLGQGVRPRPAGQAQHLAHVGLVLGLLGGELRLQIVVPVRQAETVLADVDGVAVRILGVGLDVDAEKGSLEGADLALQQRQLIAALHRSDGGEVGLQRLGAQGVDPGLVHEGVIERPGLHRIGGVVYGRRAGRLEDATQPPLGDIGHDVVEAITRLVGRDLQGAQEAAVGEGPEVVTRLYAGVLALGVEAPGPGADHRIGRRRNGRGVCEGGAGGGEGQDGAGEEADTSFRHRGS